MDEYARILQGQNRGIPCPYCASIMGHYSVCGLLNRQVGEARAAIKDDAYYRSYNTCIRPAFSFKVRSNSGELLLTPDDVKLLAEMKIKA